MKEKVKNFVKGAPGTSLLIAGCLVLLIAAAAAAGIHMYGEIRVDRKIESTKTEANTAVNVAVEHEAEASNISAERETEDDRRETAIRPKLETARRNSNSSKIQLERAREKYNEKTDPHNVNGTWADNCARLGRVFPDTKFEYCR